MEHEDDVFLILSESDDCKIEVSWVNEKGKHLVIKTETLNEVKDELLEFESYCDGIICYGLIAERQAILINPLHEEVLVLREPSRHEILETAHSSYGLGFGARDGIHKIVFLESVVSRYEGNGSYNPISQVMTLGSPEWRMISRVPNVQYTKEAVFDNGFLYWLSGKVMPQMLLVFDVQHEKFSTMATPSKVDSIIDFGGKLALLCGSADGLSSENLEVTTSSGYDDLGRINAWRKYDSMAFTAHNGRVYNANHLRVMGPWKDTSMLIKLPSLDQRLVAYNFATKTTTEVDDWNEGNSIYKTLKSSRRTLRTLSDFNASSELIYLPPGQTYNTKRSGLVQEYMIED